MQVNVQDYPILCQSGIGPLFFPSSLYTGIGSPAGNFLLLTNWRRQFRIVVCIKYACLSFNYFIIISNFIAAGRVEVIIFSHDPVTDTV